MPSHTHALWTQIIFGQLSLHDVSSTWFQTSSFSHSIVERNWSIKLDTTLARPKRVVWNRPRPVSNVAFRSCRTKLNWARLKRDFSTTVVSDVVPCLVVPSNTCALWTQIIFGQRSFEWTHSGSTLSSARVKADWSSTFETTSCHSRLVHSLCRTTRRWLDRVSNVELQSCHRRTWLIN